MKQHECVEHTFCRAEGEKNREEQFTFYGGGGRSEPLLKPGRTQQRSTFSVTMPGSILSFRSDFRRIGGYPNHMELFFSKYEGGLISSWRYPNLCDFCPARMFVITDPICATRERGGKKKVEVGHLHHVTRCRDPRRRNIHNTIKQTEAARLIVVLAGFECLFFTNHPLPPSAELKPPAPTRSASSSQDQVGSSVTAAL